MSETLAIEGQPKWIELDIACLFGAAANLSGMFIILEPQVMDTPNPHTYRGVRHRRRSDGTLEEYAWYEFCIEGGESVVKARNIEGCGIEFRMYKGFGPPPLRCDSSICHPGDPMRNRWVGTHSGIGTNWQGASMRWRGEPFHWHYYDYTFKVGWNFLSIPGDLEEPQREEVFPVAQFSAVWEMNYPKGYEIAETIVPKRAYWVKAQTPMALSLRMLHPGATAVQLRRGVNFIGSVGPRSKEMLYQPVPQDPAIAAIWTVDVVGKWVKAANYCCEQRGYHIQCVEDVTIWGEVQ